MKMKKLILILISILYLLPSLYSQQMDLVWQQCLGTAKSDYPRCIAKTNNGFLTSTTVIDSFPGISNYHGSADAWLVELDTLGNIIWEKCFGGSDGEGIHKIIELPNNEYYLFGGTSSSDGDVQSYNHNSYDIWVVKIDSSRNIIWERCYGSYGMTAPNDAIVTDDGGLLFLGSFFSSAGGDITTHYGSDDAWLCRIDSLGNILWEKTFGNHNSDQLLKILHTTRNTYMLIGSFKESGGMIECQKDSSALQRDMWLIEVDTTGEIIRQFCYGGSYWDQGYSIIEVENGYIMIGHTSSNDMDVSGLHGVPGDITVADIWVVKIEYDGNIIWQNCFGGVLTDFSYTIFTTQDNGYMFFGNTWSIDGDVIGNHNPYGDRPDIWIVTINETGELQWQQCIGGHGLERITLHSVLKLDDYNYAITSESTMLNGDVECRIDSSIYNQTADAWVFQIKDCSQYQPSIPQQPTGQDTLCVNTDSITTYTTQTAIGAWTYEWELTPEEAGIIEPENLTANIHWNPFYEGEATIKVRSTNDCGESAWSDSIIVNTYICLGTEEHEDARIPVITVYPNPASSILTVKFNPHNNNGLTTVEVIDAYGRKVYNNVLSFSTKQTKINVTNWAKGLYLIRVIENGKVVAWRKIVVE